jgi:hypothetical protein
MDMNDAGNFLIETCDETVSRDLKQQLLLLNGRWRELFVKVKHVKDLYTQFTLTIPPQGPRSTCPPTLHWLLNVDDTQLPNLFISKNNNRNANNNTFAVIVFGLKHRLNSATN